MGEFIYKRIHCFRLFVFLSIPTKMDPANIIQCLAELVNINLNLNAIQVSQKECEIAE